MRYRKKLAAIFRRWAARLDPPVVDNAPLAWIPTEELAMEILTRADAALIVFGWMRTSCKGPMFISSSRIKAADVPVLQGAMRGLGKEIGVDILGEQQ